MEEYLDYPGGLNIITSVLKSESQRQKSPCQSEETRKTLEPTVALEDGVGHKPKEWASRNWKWQDKI